MSLSLAASSPVSSDGIYAPATLAGRFIVASQGHAHQRLYKRRQVLYYEESPAVGIYLVQTGRVKLYKVSPEGKQHILKLAERGDVVALESILASDSYTTTAEMIEEGTVWFLDRETALDLIAREPQMALEIMGTLSQELIKDAEERLDLAQSSVRERLARLLTTLSQHHGISEKRGIRINVSLSREEMAEMIGTASETTMRLLKEFREDQVVEVRGRQIIVLDSSKLLRTANHSF